MGISLFSSCKGGYSINAPAPNPNPSKWTLLMKEQFTNAYILQVKYHDCTNFEGVKIMVYRGKYNPVHQLLDPHFTDSPFSPIARFRPTNEGLEMARKLAESL